MSETNNCRFLNGHTNRHTYLNIQYTNRGGSRIFLRGGGGADFQKIFEKILTNKLIFRFPSSSKALKGPCFCQIFCAAGKFLKKQVKKAVFRHFLKNVDKKIVFFWRALPLKVSIYWRPRRL